MAQRGADVVHDADCSPVSTHRSLAPTISTSRRLRRAHDGEEHEGTLQGTTTATGSAASARRGAGLCALWLSASAAASGRVTGRAGIRIGWDASSLSFSFALQSRSAYQLPQCLLFLAPCLFRSALAVAVTSVYPVLGHRPVCPRRPPASPVL